MHTVIKRSNVLFLKRFVQRCGPAAALQVEYVLIILKRLKRIKRLYNGLDRGATPPPSRGLRGLRAGAACELRVGDACGRSVQSLDACELRVGCVVELRVSCVWEMRVGEACNRLMHASCVWAAWWSCV